MIDAIFYIILAFTIVIATFFMPTPIGNENSTVRRLPYVTFSIIAVNILIFVATIPLVSKQTRAYEQTASDLGDLLTAHPKLLYEDENVRKLVDSGLISESDVDRIKRRADEDLPVFGGSGDETGSAAGQEYEQLLAKLAPTGPETQGEFDAKLADFKEARDGHIWFRFGLAPNGKWKWYQPLTSAFVHEGWFHVLGNMLFLFAVAFSLEDIWGRSVFLAFYLVAAYAACLPELISPVSVPSFGASGAVSAVMGAFLIRLYKTKIKVFWISIPYMFMLLFHRVKPFGVVNIRAYIYLPFFFVGQALNWWLASGSKKPTGVAYSVHVAGFLFGVVFALALKASRLEEKVLNPKIESKITFSGSTAVAEALELIDRGDLTGAETRLHSILARNPDDVDAVLGLIQVHQRTGAYNQLNSLYGRVIRHHLAHGDKEAALYAYDALLCAAPEGQESVQIPARDWFTICEYLKSSGLCKEASVEFERLAYAWPDTPFAGRACLQGGDAALATNNYSQALKLFRFGASLNSAGPLASKIEAALSACEEKIAGLPAWEQPKDY